MTEWRRVATTSPKASMSTRLTWSRLTTHARAQAVDHRLAGEHLGHIELTADALTAPR